MLLHEANNLMQKGWCNKSMIIKLEKGLSSLGKRPTDQVTSDDVNGNHAGNDYWCQIAWMLKGDLVRSLQLCLSYVELICMWYWILIGTVNLPSLVRCGVSEGNDPYTLWLFRNLNAFIWIYILPCVCWLCA